MGLKYSDWGDRRHPSRWMAETSDTGFWVPDRSEIVTQFFTRYLFFGLAVIYFSTLETVPRVLFSIDDLLVALGIYFLLNTWFFRQALQGVTLMKIRGAMTADLLIVTLCVIHDPTPIPPSALAFLMVLLGNGMRYGMRLFAEVLGGAVLGMAIAFALRYRLGGFDVSAGDVFFRCVLGHPGLVCLHPDGPHRGPAPPAGLPQPLRHADRAAEPPRPACRSR